jgi:hypothetical protein
MYREERNTIGELCNEMLKKRIRKEEENPLWNNGIRQFLFVNIFLFLEDMKTMECKEYEIRINKRTIFLN